MSEVTHILQQAFAVVQKVKADLSATARRAYQLQDEVNAMAIEHDQIAAIFDDIEPKVAAIIAAKGTSDQSNADLLTRAQALQKSVDTAYDALTPSSSGAGANG